MLESRTLRWPRPLVILTAAAALFPLLVLGEFYSFVLQARLELGRWPVFNDPYPKTWATIVSGFPIGHFRIGIGVIAFPVVSLAAVALSVFGRWREKDFPMWRLIGTAALAAAVFVRMAKLDPGNFWSWFWD